MIVSKLMFLFDYFNKTQLSLVGSLSRIEIAAPSNQSVVSNRVVQVNLSQYFYCLVRRSLAMFCFDHIETQSCYIAVGSLVNEKSGESLK